MSQFSVKATFDGKELVQGFKDVKKEVQGLESAGEDAKKSLDGMLQQKNSTTNYKRQLSQITAELNDLAVNYARLSDAEKQSEFGQTMSQRIDELTAKAQELKGVFADVNESLSGATPDVKVWDGMAELIEAAASGFQTYAGVLGMSEEKQEALTKTIAKMATIQAGANTVVKIGKMLQKDSNIIMAVTKVQTMAATAAIKLKTAAEVKGKAATVAATIAQKALNAAANANPYVLLASALIAVGTAIYKFTKKSNEAERQQEEFNKKQEEARELNSKLANSIGSVIAEYNLLQREYTGLSSLSDKQKWIEENASAFENLGFKIEDVNDADKVFVQQSTEVINALKARAKAEALIEKYKEAVIKAEENKLNFANNQFIPKAEVFAGGASGLPDSYKGYEDLFTGVDGYYQGGQIQYAPKKGVTQETINNRAAELKKKYNATADKDVEYWELQVDAAEKAAREAEAAIKQIRKKPSTTTKTPGSTNKTDTDIYGAESLRAAELEVQKLQDKLNRMDTTSPEFETTKQALFAAQAKVEDIKKLMAEPNPEVERTLVEQYDDAAKKINNIVKEYNIGIINEEEAKRQIDAINAELQKLGLTPIEIKLKPDVEKKGQWDGFFGKDRDTQAAIDDVVKAFNLGIIDKDYAQAIIDAINIDRINAGLPPVIINLDIERLKHGIDSALQMFDAFSSIGNIVSGINSVYESFKNLPKAMEEAENGWERFMVGFEAGMQIMNVLTTTLSTINTLMTTFQMIQELVTAGKLKDAAASGVKASADTAAAAAAGTEAAANTAAATAGAAKAVAWMPIVGPILAVAAIAAVIGGIMAARSKGKYASGGIVPGASKIGDFNIAQVNGGEMILNTRQQANLFNMLDHNRLPQSSASGEVTFRIQGDTLVGVIDNYNRKRSRI